MLFIYVIKITPRIRYIFKFFFEHLLHIDYRLIDSEEDFKQYSGPKMVYGDGPEGDYLVFGANQLLFSKGVEMMELKFVDLEYTKSLFPVYNKDSALPADIFASAFFMLTRYEEYLPYKKDVHGRFDALESINYKEGLLMKPLVNQYGKILKELLLSHFPEMKFPQQHYKYTPTYDIDSAYAFRQKGFIRSIGGLINSLIKRDPRHFIDRIRVLLRQRKDPFDTFDFQMELQKKYELDPVYFILFAGYGPYDKNLPTGNEAFRVLIKSLADYGQVGIHPSYQSNEDESVLQTEIDNLSSVLHRDITQSRQHFLRLEFPETYRNLINRDIQSDYTMGYAARPGFRAGICTPFLFYDLRVEAESNLMVYPFAVMDGTLKDYMKLTPSEALETISTLIQEVKDVDGHFISLWHNESLCNEYRWAGWKEVYEQLVRLAIP